MPNTKSLLTINEDNLKIHIIFKDEGRLLANVHISIKTHEYGFITLKSFRIWKSDRMNERLQEQLNITPPSQKVYSKYIPLIFIEKIEDWSALEKRIYDAFCLARQQRHRNISEDVNPDDIQL